MVVLIETSWIVFKAVLSKQEKNSFYEKVFSQYTVSVEKQFTIDGSIFSQQNRFNICCSHTSLQTVLAICKDKEIAYPEINKVLRRHKMHSIPKAIGFTADQLKLILSHFKLNYFPKRKDVSRKKNSNIGR